MNCFFRSPFFFLHPSSEFIQGEWNNRPVCAEKTGLYFHTLPGGHQCSEGEGGWGGDSHGGRSVDGSKPEITGKPKTGKNYGDKDAESKN